MTDELATALERTIAAASDLLATLKPRIMNMNDGSDSADHPENDDCGELGCTPALTDAQPHIDHCDCSQVGADDRCVAYRAILAEGKVLDYDGTKWPITTFRTHLWTQHGVNEEALNANALAAAHATAHRRESGIGDREPTVNEVAAMVIKFIDEDINSDYANGRTPPMPWNVMDFSHLHDFRDANEYLIQAEAHFGNAPPDEANDVSYEVTALLAARTDNLKPILDWRTDETHARIVRPDWLTDGRPFVLHWTDYVANDWSKQFENLSEAVVALAMLIRCGEDAWRSGFNVDGEELDDVIADFFGKAIT